RLRSRPDPHHPAPARAIAFYIGKVIAALATHEPVVAGYQRLGSRGHIAPAAGLVDAGEEMQPVGRIGVLVEPERELGMAVGVGTPVLQVLLIAVVDALAVVEMPVWPGVERR